MKALLALTACLLGLLGAGCGAVGRVTEGDAGHGKQLFLQAPGPSKPTCASCHTLADAGSKGTVGPNLDDAFASAKAQTMQEQTIKDVVRGQIAYPEEPMPAELYQGQDADDLATYIAKCAGNPHCGVTATHEGQAAPAPAPGGGGGGGGGGGAAANGKQVFASAGCGACHTLKDAGASGNVGPNLDGLKPSKDAVAHQVEVGGGGMPAFKGQLSDAQIQAVAAYVSSVAGK